MPSSPTSDVHRKLDRSTIVRAAIRRIETHGLADLSARKLARDLRCEAMSLYHHVGSMNELKDAIVDSLLGSIAPASAPSPAEALASEASDYLALARKYPRSFALIATRRWKGERAAATAGRAVARFQQLGFGAPESLRRARVLGAYLNGAGLALAAWAAESDDALTNDARAVRKDLQDGLSLLLGTLIRAEPTP